MSTRGVWGFLVDGKTKAIYNQSDSYPTGLGKKVLEACKQAHREKAWENIPKRVRAMEMVDLRAAITPEQSRKIRSFSHAKFKDEVIPSGADWEFFFNLNCVDCPHIADVINGTALPFAPDSEDFLGDSLFCEWAYIVNLDDKLIEVHCGGNKNAAASGRYVHQNKPRDGYMGVRHLLSIPFDALDAMNNTDTVVAEMEAVDNDGTPSLPVREYFTLPEQFQPTPLRLEGITSIQVM